MPTTTETHWFASARFGMIVHYGLYSLLGRGEWAMNRERIPRDVYRQLADRFTADAFDADTLCELAVRSGMKYVVFTTMHHDGFRLYDTDLSDFNSVRACGRDLVAEMIAAARKRGLRIGLYHSLNNWMDAPDACDALESDDAYEQFIESTHRRIEELVRRYDPVDVLWYDGWWPFDAARWRAAEMNAMVRRHQPHILFNGRNGLPGDFATPEQHVTSPSPWRLWEACMTLNNSWGFHAHDDDWKSARSVVDMLATVANGCGNLLLNVGPRGDGSIPEPTTQVLEAVGKWLAVNGESLAGRELFTMDPYVRTGHRADWCCHGPFTVSGNCLYLLVRRWPGESLTFAGLEARLCRVTLMGGAQSLRFEQVDDRVTVFDLPATPPDPVCPVLRFECDAPPSIYLCGGMRVPRVDHVHYDPCPSELNGAHPG